MEPAILQEVPIGQRSPGSLYRYARARPVPQHFHPQIEFMLVTRGRCVECVGGRNFDVHRGQLIWHLPGVGHRMVAASADFDCRVVHLEPDLALHASVAASYQGWAKSLGLWVAGSPVVELRQSVLHALLENCEDTPLAGSAPSLSAARALLADALHATRTDHDERRPLSFAQLALCLLLEDPTLGRREICRDLDVSEGYFSRQCRSEFGIGFVEMRARVRVVRFVSHVARERRNLLDAALTAGFGSYPQLHRDFRKIVGYAPRDYFNTGRSERARMLGDRYRCL